MPQPRLIALYAYENCQMLDLIGPAEVFAQANRFLAEAGRADEIRLAAVAEEAVTLAGRGTAGIHVSFDMDACDPAIAPGVGTPVKGGLNYREAHLLMEIVAASARLTSLDVVEINPTLDVRNATAILATELVMSAFGLKIL